MTTTKTLELHGGDPMPALGLGTWKSAPGEVGAAVEEALRIGYRHLDCAAIYGNEAEIGEALARCFAKGLVSREELWVTSKLWNDRHATDDVVPALEQTLADLRLDHLDLYLIHWPVAQRRGVLGPEKADDLIGLDELPLAATWVGMEAALNAGLCRHIGVSNCSVAKLEGLLANARHKPEANQVELHPYLQQPELVTFCREHGVAVTAYSPLGSLDRPATMKQDDEPLLLEDPVIVEIAGRIGASPAQVLLAWQIERGVAVIPKSVHPGRLKENLDAAELSLAPDDMRAIEGLDRGRRYITGAFWAIEGSAYTLANLWDA